MDLRIATAQNYTDLPIQMRWNTMIFMILRLNEMNTTKQIWKNCNSYGDSTDLVKKAYVDSTKHPPIFFLLDLTSTDDKRYGHNFLDIIKI